MTRRIWPFSRRWSEHTGEPRWKPEWTDLLERTVAGYRGLDTDERTRLAAMADALVHGFRWEAARDFELTDEMKVVIAGNAALLVLELGIEQYRGITSVIVHPGPIVLSGVRAGPAQGVVTTEEQWLDGEAHHAGPVLLAWGALRSEARFPDAGRNVVFHEFAHRLDMLDGVTDGTPPLGDADRLARWVEVCTREYEALRTGEVDPVLRSYAAENVGEFFAVATEVFFCRPLALAEAKPDLYAVLADFYRQDPARRARTEA